MLVEAIVQTAAGVFLWVTLVVKSLLSGLRNGDGIRHLRQRLASLPADLKGLYDHMLDSIELLYKEEASQIFQIFRASGHKLNFLTLDRALRFSDHRQVIDLAVSNPQSVENASQSIDLEIVAMKLNSRCKGLLEASDRDWSPNTGQVPHLPHVAFLHRAFREYLAHPHVWVKLLTMTKHSGFDPETVPVSWHMS
ncbi:MAG: hypothetical protein WKG07_01200 [Hymenobacter sp.]